MIAVSENIALGAFLVNKVGITLFFGTNTHIIMSDRQVLLGTENQLRTVLQFFVGNNNVFY